MPIDLEEAKKMVDPFKCVMPDCDLIMTLVRMPTREELKQGHRIKYSCDACGYDMFVGDGTYAEEHSHTQWIDGDDD